MWQEAWQSGNRDLLLNRLRENKQDEWDVVIAGGGITGAGIAREAARRGLSVLLVDRQDFAWGTSSRSSKMVHGGLRYIAAGDIILPKGKQLRAQDLGLIASIGVAQVLVYKPLRIATFTTGQELLEPGEPAEAGKVYNANRYILSGLIPQLGCELIDLGRVPDNLDATIETLKQAASVADVLITTGGVSVGDEDYIKPAVESTGHLDLWKVKMKPGKPIAYGEVAGKPFIGLPGNPVSAFTTFTLFARPYLLTMQGQVDVLPKPIWLVAGFDWPKSGFRREFVRAKLENNCLDKAQHNAQNHSQITEVILFPNQGSGVLTSTVWADGLAVIPEDTTVMKVDLVAYYAFNALEGS